ncbi:MAG: T9SS type A sorting domain-containing protein [Bacteroidetes bacterium]|nr:MAG: T9SS type A sorting domain-containing protein [Bacteroidota bacterium]
MKTQYVNFTFQDYTKDDLLRVKKIIEEEKMNEQRDALHGKRTPMSLFNLSKLMIIFLFFSFFLLGHYKKSYAQVQFPFKIGAAGSDQGYKITRDASNNIYVVGVFQQTVDFDPGGGTANLTSPGGGNPYDVFVAKYSSSGVYQWAFNIGGTTTNDYGRDIAVDAAGNVYITGQFVETFDVDPGGGTVNLVYGGGGNMDSFIAKYNSSGIYQWAFSLGSSAAGSYVYGFGITTDAGNNVLVTGAFGNATIDFDPGGGVANLTGSGVGDAFVAKYNSSGIYQWAFNIGNGAGGVNGKSISTDPGNNVYITGSFNGFFVDFDPGAGTVTRGSDGGGGSPGDLFVAKYNASGGFQWVFTMGSSGSPDEGRGISIDAGNNVLVAGHRNGRILFAKLNSSGVQQWLFYTAAGSGVDYGEGIDTDAANNVYITGMFQGTVDFDLGAGTANLISAGNNDIFVAKYDPSGNYICAFKIGAGTDDRGYGIVSDGGNNVYVTGTFWNTPDFDPGAGTINLTASNYDIYVAAYTMTGCPPTPLPVELLSFNAACNSETIKCQWATASETNNDYFTVERSLSFGEGWGEVGTVQGSGNSSTIRNYEFIDETPLSFGEGLGYYRLKQTDFDGNYEYFGPVSVKCDGEQQITILPSVSNNGYFTVVGKGKADELFIYNLLGEKVFSVRNQSFPFVVNISANNSGIYLIHVKEKGKEMNQKIIISK